jgi:hypothetical protein
VIDSLDSVRTCGTEALKEGIGSINERAPDTSCGAWPCKYCRQPIPPHRVKAALRVHQTPSYCRNSHRVLASMARKAQRGESMP